MPPGGSCVPCTISDMAIGLGLYCTGPAHRKITAGWVFFIINCRQIDREGTMYHTCALAVSPRQFAAHELPRWHKHYNLKVITLTIINIHEHPHKKENKRKETANRLLCILIIYIQNEHIYIYTYRTSSANSAFPYALPLRSQVMFRSYPPMGILQDVGWLYVPMANAVAVDVLNSSRSLRQTVLFGFGLLDFAWR